MMKILLTKKTAVTVGSGLLAALCVHTANGQDKVVGTVHNLSAGGPGTVRATTESRVCVFCHAPHVPEGMRPLWNRATPVSSYLIYSSSTVDFNPGQPTGSSKFCLSCHDGTIALGSVLTEYDKIQMSTGDYIPLGASHLGTDLSDDHPVSFPFDSGLAVRDPQLRSPSELPPEVRLDPRGELQCTSCHDAHSNIHGDFLVMNSGYGALCVSCHEMTGWRSTTHSLSTAPLPSNAPSAWSGATVAESACGSCHRTHGAGGHQRLMIFNEEEKNCLSCHDGSVARTNILAELDKLSGHDPRKYEGVHDPRLDAENRQHHVECSDCHNPHAVRPEAASGTREYKALGETLIKTAGVNSGGASIPEARNEYEICFRCHGDSPVPLNTRPIRQADTTNLRIKLSSVAVSSHPVVESITNSETVSLVPGLTQGSMIRCTDCHNSDDSPRVGGQGPDGPHGSTYRFLLDSNYTTTDNSIESPFEYALCYKCHQRSSILNDDSFKEHRLHIVDEQTPCSACHDPHGIDQSSGSGSDHTHLINFDTVIVRPESQTGVMEFRDLGHFSGSCTLNCHGEDHRDEGY